ncbi:UbiA family prenyltransferase [Novipirellula caenicola]|uniref:Protoheme IX farnesyltransferase n=1 Tax=Novipirellula caenicola TaxID=1536901 RepID=A0ABP9VZV0_9BACT
MTAETQQTSPLFAWAQLVRLPNVFTVVADVSAAFLLAAQGPTPVVRWICVLAAGISLYWAGMILNDVFDIERDRAERPKRPLPSGRISLAAARAAGWAILILGVILGSLSGYLPGDNLATTWLPAATSIVLAVMIVAYDGPLKKTPLAPAAMGACRFLSFLLGASPVIIVQPDGPLVPLHLVAFALGFGIYITGITLMARDEASGGNDTNLKVGLSLIVIGLFALAFAPQQAPAGFANFLRTPYAFPLLIAMIAYPVVLRGIRCVRHATPANVQTTIRSGILSIIPLAAAVAMLGAGPLWGLAIFALIIPAIGLASAFRVT